MIAICNETKKFISYEDIYVSIINEELDTFFINCNNSLNNYLSFLSQNLNNHSIELFKSTVISDEQIFLLVKRIYKKLQNKLTENIESSQVNVFYKIITNNDYCKFLDDIIYKMNITNKTVIICEKLIDKIFSKILNNMDVNSQIKDIIKKLNLSKELLKDFFEESKKNHKKIEHQLKGILINIKLDIRNTILENISSIFEQQYDYAALYS